MQILSPMRGCKISKFKKTAYGKLIFFLISRKTQNTPPK
jgi:hypothetical protein